MTLFMLIFILSFSALVVSAIDLGRSSFKFVCLSEKHFHYCQCKIKLPPELEMKRNRAYTSFKFFIGFLILFVCVVLRGIYVASGPYAFFYILSAITGGAAVIFFVNLIPYFVLYSRNKDNPKKSNHFGKRFFVSLARFLGVLLITVFLVRVAISYLPVV